MRRAAPALVDTEQGIGCFEILGHIRKVFGAWLGEFLTELLSFPNGRHDDQVDSVSQFLRWLQDAYLNQISFHVPFVVSRPREFLPP